MDFKTELKYNTDILKCHNSSPDVIILLDESGSMAFMEDEPVKCITEFLKLRDSLKESKFTVATFNNTLKYKADDLTYDEPYEFSDYSPSFSTALYDAVCKIIMEKISETNKEVIFIIITDGMENSSSLFTSNDTKELVEKAQNKNNWKIVFIGASEELVYQATSLSMKRENCMTFNQDVRGDLLRISRSVSSDLDNYVSLVSEQSKFFKVRKPKRQKIVSVSDKIDYNDLKPPILRRECTEDYDLTLVISKLSDDKKNRV